MPFLLMGILCLLSAIGEYLYPLNPRPIPKAVYGLQIILGLATVLVAGYFRARFNRLNLTHTMPVAFTLFFFFLLGIGFSINPSDMVYAIPRTLKMLAVSLIVFLPLIISIATLTLEALL